MPSKSSITVRSMDMPWVSPTAGASGAVEQFRALGLPYEPARWRRDDAAQDSTDAQLAKQLKVSQLVNAYRVRGHLIADLDPLRHEPSVDLRIVQPGQPIPVADLVLLPGSKSTIGDLRFLRQQGWDIDIAAHVRRGGRMLGLCGGYQMLGRVVRDPEGIEGPAGEAEGLGLLDIETDLTSDKTLTASTGMSFDGHPVTGYEIHIGRTAGPDTARPLVTLDGSGPDGARSPDGRVAGCYLHGLFASDVFRRAYLVELGAAPGAAGLGFEAVVDQTLDRLADHLETVLDIEALLAAARELRI